MKFCLGFLTPLAALTWIAVNSAPLFSDEPKPPDLYAGFGEADITPQLGEKPVYMAGFGQNRTATKVHDPLLARALVLRQDGLKLALVSIDVVGFFHDNVL